jgi:hypothetical protein
MRTRALLALLGVVALAALALGRGPAGRPSPRAAGGAREAARPPVPEPSSSAVDPGAIRDVFRFADDPVLAPSLAARPRGAEAEEAPAPPGPRLVGLLRRSGRLVAALAAGREVEIAGPGERAAGVTVVSVGEDHVRVRRADGSEETLVLP